MVAVVVLGVVIVTAAAVVMNSPRWRQKAKEQQQESVLDFAASTAEPQRWRLTGIQDPSGEIKYQTPASQIGVLPCLDAKPASKPDQKPQ